MPKPSIDYNAVLERLRRADTTSPADLHMSLHAQAIAAIESLLALTRALAAKQEEYKAGMARLVQRLVQEDLVPRDYDQHLREAVREGPGSS